MADNEPTGDDDDTRRTPDASQPQPSDDVAGDGNPGDDNAGDDDDTPEGRATQLNMYLSDDGDVLDLTGNQLKDLAGIPLPPTLTDLDLTTNRLAALDPRIGDLERLEKLSFRQNLITDAAAAGLKDLTRLTSLKGVNTEGVNAEGVNAEGVNAEGVNACDRQEARALAFPPLPTRSSLPPLHSRPSPLSPLSTLAPLPPLHPLLLPLFLLLL
ncbi:unnamed protein product [Closterium sp. NIES-54]